MTQEVPTQETQNPQGETEDSGSLDAAAAAFAANDEPEEGKDKQTEAEPDNEPGEDSEQDADEADPSEEDKPEELVEVEFEGKTFKVAPELQKGLLRQSDYSRKMNEVSEKEKTYTARLELMEGLEQIAEKRAEALAEVRSIDKQIKQYEGIDWAKARAENPSEAALAAVELLTLQNSRKDAVSAAASIARELTEGRNKLLGERHSDMAKVLDKELPGWRGEAGVALTAYAVSNNWKPEELGAVTDARVILALEKARKYDAFQKSKSELKAKAKDAPPVVKPGSPRPRTNAGDEVMARLRKSNSVNDAEAAFLSRMR